MKQVIIFLSTSSLLLTACSSAKKVQPSPIEVAHGIAGGRPYEVVITRLKELSTATEEQEEVTLEKVRKPHPSMVKPAKTNKITVKKGDTLFKIAEKYKIDMEHLASLNAIQPPYEIKPGQILYLE